MLKNIENEKEEILAENFLFFVFYPAPHSFFILFYPPHNKQQVSPKAPACQR